MVTRADRGLPELLSSQDRILLCFDLRLRPRLANRLFHSFFSAQLATRHSVATLDLCSRCSFPGKMSELHVVFGGAQQLFHRTPAGEPKPFAAFQFQRLPPMQWEVQAPPLKEIVRLHSPYSWVVGCRMRVSATPFCRRNPVQRGNRVCQQQCSQNCLEGVSGRLKSEQIFCRVHLVVLPGGV